MKANSLTALCLLALAGCGGSSPDPFRSPFHGTLTATLTQAGVTTGTFVFPNANCQGAGTKEQPNLIIDDQTQAQTEQTTTTSSLLCDIHSDVEGDQITFPTMSIERCTISVIISFDPNPPGLQELRDYTLDGSGGGGQVTEQALNFTMSGDYHEIDTLTNNTQTEADGQFSIVFTGSH